MDQQQLVEQIASTVIKDMQVWVAIIGFIGVIAGALLTVAGNILLHWIQQRRTSSIDEIRKELLIEMLGNPSFTEGRSLESLSRVSGTTSDECRKLLIEIKARGFTLNDGREGWTYREKRPLGQ